MGPIIAVTGDCLGTNRMSCPAELNVTVQKTADQHLLYPKPPLSPSEDGGLPPSIR
jgi:hypothetical protein